VTVAVTDAEGTAQIDTPPSFTLQAAQQGRMLVERRVNGQWKLFTMNPDGSAEVQLTPEGVQELMPSVDRTGNKIAFIEERTGFDDRRVRVRTLDSSFNRFVDDGIAAKYTSVSLSPSGEWVSYRRDDLNKLKVKRVDGTGGFELDQQWSGSGHQIKKNKSGFSPDSRWLFYEHQRNLYKIDLQAGVQPTVGALYFNAVTTTGDSGTINEALYCPVPFKDAAGNEFMVISVGNNNSRLIVAPVDFEASGPYGGDPVYPYPRPDYGVTNGFDSDYPSVSSDGRFLSMTRSPQSSSDTNTTVVSDDEGQEVVVLEWNGSNNFDQNRKVITGDVRRSSWLPADDDSI
jgi:Tol biopolymer transport system component